MLGITKDEASFKNAEASVRSLAGTATKLLGAIGIGLSLKAMNALAEDFNGINDSIRDATRGMGDQLEIQQKIMDAANTTKLNYGTMAKNITLLVKMNKELFTSVEKAADFTTLFTKNLRAAGKGEGEVSAAITMLNRTLARGQLDASAYERMLRSYPETINTIAEGMGVSQEELKKLASNGKVTSEAIVNAFTKASESIDSRFNELDYSISDALINIRNKWGIFIDQVWVGSNITNGVGKMMVQVFDRFLDLLKKIQPYMERFIKFILSKVRVFIEFLGKVADLTEKLIKRFGGFENLARAIGVAISLAVAYSKFPKILAGLKALTNLLKGPALLFVALGLAIEDFVQFLLGNESVIGEVFENFGITADDVRNKFTEVWGNIKDFLLETWETIKAVGESLWEGLQSFWEEHGESIKGLFAATWEAIKAVIDDVKENIGEVINTVVSWFEENKETLSKIFDEIVRIITIAFETIGNLVEPVIEIFTGLMNFIRDVFKGDWDAAWEDIKNIFSAVKDAFSVIIDGIRDMFGGLIDSALNWGKDLIQNIIDGITGGIGKVKEAVSNIGETISSFLHFSEPDEGPLSNFHTWMPDMMKGLALGIDDNQFLVMDGIKKLAGGISSLMQNATSTASMFGRRSSNVTQNVTFNNSYSGSQMDAIRSVAQVTKQSAIDATTLMARGLSIAR